MRTPALQYTVRESPKARHIRLKMSMQRGLEVIVPKGFPRSRVPPLLEKKRRWIRSARQRIQKHAKFFRPSPPDILPDHVILRAVGETWRVDYRETKERSVGVHVLPQFRLLVRGHIQNREACKAALRRWLARHAHAHLVPRLQLLSRATGLHYKRAYVKRQKTRWASCSRHKAISINAKLLFVSSELVDYTFIHELCHTKEMNHSKRFWTLLAAHCPDYGKLDADLRHMWKIVPSWAI